MQPRFAIAAGLCLSATLVASPVISLRSATPIERVKLGSDDRSGPSDAWLATTAKIAILTSIRARGSTVQVNTMHATMTLYGKVTSLADKRTVEKLVRSMEGVREVRNLLMIAPVADGYATSDSELQSQVAVALVAAGLKKDSPLSGSTVSVQSVVEGTVFLTGTATSLTAHLRAIETARAVQGVRAVRSDIQSPDARAVYHARVLGQ